MGLPRFWNGIELDVMHALWASAPLKVSEILTRLSRKSKPAYTSLLTLVQTMEKKGYIRHIKDGKAYSYFPVLKKDLFKSSEIQRITKRLFGGSSFSLAVSLIQDEDLSPSEIEELKKILEGR